MPRAPKSITTRASKTAARTNPLGSKKSSSKVKQEATDEIASTSEEKPAVSSLDQDANQDTKSGSDTKSNYLLLVHMTFSTDPIITRLLSLPPHLTFDKFHHVLQIAFGWANCHMHSFRVTLAHSSWQGIPRPVLYLESSASDVIPEPTVIQLSEADYTLHDVFSRNIFSRDVLLNTEWEFSKVTPEMKLGLEYEYDMGDGWVHQITLLGRADPGLHWAVGGHEAPTMLCLSGEGHPCAEDCGSELGWEHLKELFAKPKKKDPDDARDWYKNHCANGDSEGLDPWKWDIFEVNDELRKLKW